MNFIDEVDRIERQIPLFKKKGENKLPSSCYFLKDGILSLPSFSSLCRKPYSNDGLTLWAYQNGKISLNESSYFIIPETIDGESNFLSFFLGIKKKNEYLPFSLFDYNKNIYEKGVTRYTVFKDGYVIYVLKKDGVLYATRLGIDENKNFVIEGFIKNNSKNNKSVYSSIFFNPMLMHSNYSSIETKWFKKCEYRSNCFHFETVEDLSRTIHLSNEAYFYRNVSNECNDLNTTSREIYCNGKNHRLEASSCLKEGKFPLEKNVTVFSDTSIAGDFLSLDLKPSEIFEFSYLLSSSKNNACSLLDVKSFFDKLEKNNNFSFIPPYFKFNFVGNGGEKLSLFFKELVKQVQYCASCKNSTLSMLGVRDIYQAIEAQIIYNPTQAKEKMLDCLSYLDKSGRSPRQFSHKEKGVNEIRIDSREFIDQGLWIIDAIYQYLAYTNDAKFLNEEVGFIKISGSMAYVLNETSSVFDHINRIISYLISNIDSNTNCLKTLYGDWNDAIDGLGKGKDENSFGNGVSTMATFQLYKALNLYKEICSFYKLSGIKVDEYISKLENGILTNCVVTNGEDKKIIHGWGNNRSFLVGSFKDIDNQNRDALTSNAFYFLSGFASSHPELAPFAKAALKRLEGKYGFLTFNVGFKKDTKEVGRIVNLPIGTAENAATYIHGALFGVDSLFIQNEPKWAFEEIDKLLPINHKFVTTTPFVMPNSYVYNLDLGLDGESMNDWFTGSSSTLLKMFTKNVFGLDVKLDHINFVPTSFIPFKKASCNFEVEGKRINISIINDKKKSGCYLNNVNLVGEKDTFNRLIYKINKSSLKPKNDLTVYLASN